MDQACEKYRNWMMDEVADELDPQLRDELNDHLADCSRCRQEQQELAATVRRLAETQDVGVPRHFYVYGDPGGSRLGLLEGFLRLTPAWRLVGASAVLLLATGVLLVALQTQVVVSEGSLTVILGQKASVPEFDPADFKEELIQLVHEQVATSDNDRDEAMREELATFLEETGRKERDQVETALVELEARLLDSIRSGDRSLQDQLETSFSRLLRDIVFQHQEDMRIVRHEMVRLSTFDSYQTGQASLILNRLSQMQQLTAGEGLEQ
jgi:hypothetical protein